jgi:hypothetical protein
MHTDIALDPTFYAVANIDGGIAAYVSPAARHTTVVVIEANGLEIDRVYFADTASAIQFAVDAAS